MSTCTASASDSSRRLRSSSPVSCSAAVIRWRSQPVSAVAPSRSAAAAACRSWPTWRRSVRRRSPSWSGEQPPGQALDERDPLQQRRDAAHAQHARPLVQAPVDLLPRLLPGARDLLGVPAEERRERGGAGAGGRARALDRLQQPQPVARGLGAEHAARAVDHGGDLDRVERVAHERRLAVGAHEHRDVPRPHRVLPEHRAVLGPALDPRAGGEQPDEIAGEVARDVAARGVVARVAVAGLLDRRIVAVHDAHPQRLGMRRAEQPRRAVGARGAHGAVGDPLVAEPRVGEQRVVGLQQALVAAPVDLERGARRRRTARPRGTRRRRRRGTRRSPAWGRR